MNDSINSQVDNLADIVGMDAILQPQSISPMIIAIVAIIFAALLWLFYERFKRSTQGQLRRLKQQLQNAQLSPRDGAHKIAVLFKNHHFNVEQLNVLKQLRFAPTPPSLNQILDFIAHV